MLFTTPDLDDDDRRVLAEVEAYYDAFRQATGTVAPADWVGGLRKRLVAGAIRGSTAIEGYVVSASTALSYLSGSNPTDDVPEDTRDAVLGYRDALGWVTRTPEMEFFAYGETVLSALHFMMTRTRPAIRPGRYRTTGIAVTGGDPLVPAYVGPPAVEVPTLMGELVEWLTAGDLDAPVLVRAAMAHLDLVSIHPWRDGNGRMGRCLQTLVIARGGLLAPEFCSIEEWLGHDVNTLAYYAELNATGATYRPDGDAHAWVRFVLRAHHLQAQLVDRRLRRDREIWTGLADLADRLGLDPRTVPALYAAATESLSRTVYQRDEGLSRDQAVRDIRELAGAGLIEGTGYGTTLRYHAAGDAREIAEAATIAVTAPPVEPYPLTYGR